MKSANTDKSQGIKNCSGWMDDEKFRDVRVKAQAEYREIKHKKKKKKNIKLPCYEVGDRVVLAVNGRGSRDYTLVEVVDFTETYRTTDFKYYAIVLKVTHKKKIERIGRLCNFTEGGFSWFNAGTPAHVPEDGINWLE